jgi:hypothetical protein
MIGFYKVTSLFDDRAKFPLPLREIERSEMHSGVRERGQHRIKNNYVCISFVKPTTI